MKPTPKQQLGRALLERGVKTLMEEAKVPMQVHLKVVQALHQAMAQHKADLAKYDGQMTSFKDEFNALHGHVHKVAEKMLNTDFTGQPGQDGEPGEKGDQGDPGEVPAVSVEEITMRLLPLVIANMPQPEKGEAGKDAETPKIDELVTAVIKELQKGDKLHISHVAGAGSFIKDGVRYRVEELMHGAGSSSGGAGITVITISGTIDDSNVTFSAASEPTLLNINGGLYSKTGGSITWSYAAGTITLSSPVGTGGSISGLK